MKNVLVDTDILIHFLRGNVKALNVLSGLLEDADISCSVITVAEIHAGMKPHEREKTVELLDSLTILDITVKIAEKAGQYKRSIKSQNLELDDCFIAATAHEKNALLLTGNGKHYPMTDVGKKIVLF
jgi:predicted nucleic acid-binding protein